MKSRYEWDSEVPGLGLRVNARAKTWILKYRVNGKQLWATFGAEDELPVEEARALARRFKRKAKVGEDPLPECRKPMTMEFSAFADLYMERYSKHRKRSWYKDEQTLRCHAVPAFKGKYLHEIRRSDIAAVHHRIGTRYPYAANRMRELLHTMFKLAGIWDLIPEDMANPANGISDFKEVRRERWLTPQEMERVIAVVDALECPAKRAIIWIYMSTGLRRSEPLSLEWSQVDFNRGEIHIPKNKSDRPHCVPLPPHVMSIISGLPRLSIYVFPGQIAGTHFKRIDKVWTRIRKKAQLGPEVTIHTIRHSVGSWLAQSGTPLRLVGEVLNHADYKSTLIYTHFARDNVRDALGKHVEALMSLRKDHNDQSVQP